MKRSLSFGFFLGYLAVGSFAAAGAPPDSAGTSRRTVQLLETGQPVRIVCFGDSCTGVYYHTGDRRA